MSGNDHIYFQKKLHEMCGITNPNDETLIAINMDWFETAFDKRNVFLYILDNINNGLSTDFYNDVGLIVLDGIADLVTDANTEEDARILLEKVKARLNKNGCVLLTVLHTEKTGEYSRGSLGTILDQKASAILKCVKDNEPPNDGYTTVVSPVKIRSSREFEPFELSHDEDGNLLLQGEILENIKPVYNVLNLNDYMYL